jgi:hypothetical protein
LPGNAPDYQAWLHYVYLWVCRVPGGTFVKVGMTNDPDRRAKEFRTSCPFRVTEHLICQCPTRSDAAGLEKLLLHTFRAYRQHGEWVRVPDGKIEQFVGGCTAIARNTVSPLAEFRAHKPRRKRRAAARTASDRASRHT